MSNRVTNIKQPGEAPIVVVGSGPVGARVTLELLKRSPNIPVVLYGNEPWRPYDRVRLSSMMAGEVSHEALFNNFELPDGAMLSQRYNCPVVAIDRGRRTIKDASGHRQAYSKLILATGSRPYVPKIRGIEQSGVYTFRNMSDAEKLMARRARASRVVVLGGGLLGLEAAKVMQKGNTEVIIVEHNMRLMMRQLDQMSADLLREEMMRLGIKVVLSDGIKEIYGEGGRVTSIHLRSDRIIQCDTVIVATGIMPNTELAREADIAYGRGIRVNDQMQTSDPNIYAIGECAEHRGRVYGLVAPGFEHASVAVHNILGNKSNYTGSIAATQLKVVGLPVFSMGEVDDDLPHHSFQQMRYEDPINSIYRKLVFRNRRLVGAVAIGEWPELVRIQALILNGHRQWPWQQRRFMQTGSLYPEAEGSDVSNWPAKSVVCHCAAVTRAELTGHVMKGCTSLDELARCSSAGLGCGSCRPLLSQLLGSISIVEPEPARGMLAILSMLVATMLMAIILLSTLMANDNPEVGFALQQFWYNVLPKQVTGYVLLAMTVVLAALSLRKRIKVIRWGGLAWWRLIHVALGVMMVGLLLLHTGMQLGEQVNGWLMSNYLALALVGSLGGAVIGFEAKLARSMAERLRKQLLWLHILLIWPLTALLGYHIFSAYYV